MNDMTRNCPSDLPAGLAIETVLCDRSGRARRRSLRPLTAYLNGLRGISLAPPLNAAARGPRVDGRRA
jgi:hypothetical protein